MQEIRQRNLGVVCEIRGGGCGWFGVQLFDGQGQCVCQRFCPSERVQWLAVPAKGSYELRVSAQPSGGMNLMCAHRWVTLSPYESKCQHFIFNRRSAGYVPVQLTLRDANYSDLPIEGGKLYLWPSM